MMLKAYYRVGNALVQAYLTTFLRNPRRLKETVIVFLIDPSFKDWQRYPRNLNLIMLKIISLSWLDVFNSDNFSIVSEERNHFCKETTQKNVFTNKNIDMQNILDQTNKRLLL